MRKIKRKKNKTRNIFDIIEKRYLFLVILVIISFFVVSFKLFNVQIINNEEYLASLEKKTEKMIEGSSAPRGRIYDRNYNLLVDNEAIKTIYYKKENKVTVKEEIELAYKIGSMIELDFSKLTDRSLREFYLINNEDVCQNKITDSEWRSLEERKISTDDIRNYKIERITIEELSAFTDVDKEAAYLYYLMNKGYSYDEKIIKNVGVTEEEYAIISENISSLKGFNTKLDWDRIYLYGDTFKTILGKVSSENQGIPAELKDYYLENGYALNDRVGISYLEYQYENYLKGEKPVYRILSDNSYELVSEGSRGNDIVLTIDIELQQEVERILSEEVLNAKSEANTEYYNRSFVVIQEPSTGQVLAMAGKQVIENDGNLVIVDYTPGIVTLPVTPGSIVKGASISVGYKYGAIDIGTTMYDECIKIKDTPLKCSWQNLGTVNDITALQLSSNAYQFKIAMSVGGATYQYDAPLSIDTSAFDKYRDMYKQYGLGEKTNIDLPVESLGYKGTSTLSGHLLDFSIGQYDTYTPIQLSQYISTIANKGTRVRPFLLKEVYTPSFNSEEKFGEMIYSTNVTVEGHVDLEEKYMTRIREGFKSVINGSLGWGYMGNYSDAGGKTGTSQSFIDTDNDGVVDTETITTTFGGYAPSENPVMSIVTISPDVSHGYSNIEFTSSVNKRINSRCVNKFFELYK